MGDGRWQMADGRNFLIRVNPCNPCLKLGALGVLAVNPISDFSISVFSFCLAAALAQRKRIDTRATLRL
jgi:hypothetical protein